MRKFLFLALCLVFGGVVNAQTVILSQDFESGTPPTGWTLTQNSPSVGFEFGTNLGSSYVTVPAHTRYAMSNDDANDNSSATANLANLDRLISPVMDLTPYAGNGVVIQFDYYLSGEWGSSGYVEVSTNGGTSWTSVQTLSASPGAWQQGFVDITAYTSSSTVQFCFHHDDGGAWADALGADDVVVKTVPTFDGAVTAVTTNQFVQTGNVTVSGELTNYGSTPITSIDLSYSVNGGGAVTQTFSGLNITLGNTSAVNFTTQANIPTASSNDICIWVAGNINGSNPDAVASNDTSCGTVNTLSSLPSKRAILEDHTGAWCQFCPDGTVISEQVAQTYSNAIVIAVHNNDAMDIPEGNTISAEYISGFPGGTVDHYKFDVESAVELNRGVWSDRMAERLAMISPVAVSIQSQTWNASSRQISFTVKADFVGPVTGDIRMNGYIIEDGVTGNGNGYDQVNFYNTQSGHPYYQAGNPIVGFVHDHVARAMLGGAWGQTGIIPGTVNDGDSYTYTFTYTLPASYDETKIKLVGLVQMYDADNTKRGIMNAIEEALAVPIAIDNNISDINSIHPNPFAESAQIMFTLESVNEVRVEIMDLQGKVINVIANETMNSGTHQVVWKGTDMSGNHVANGVYMVSVLAGGQRMMKKVILSR